MQVLVTVASRSCSRPPPRLRLTEPVAAARCCCVMAILSEASDAARPSAPAGTASGLALPLRGPGEPSREA